MPLGELTATSQGQADSLYSLLNQGVEFDMLVRQSQQMSSTFLGRFIGAASIARFPPQVRDELRRLATNQVTRPIRVGAAYVIYKRLERNYRLNVPQ